MARRRITIPLLWLLLMPLPAASHEVWLDPVRFQTPAGAAVEVNLRNGERFEGNAQPYNTYNFVRFERVHAGEAHAIPGRLGNRPAYREEGLAEGLHVLVYQSRARWLRYPNWEKFAKFAAHKDFAEIEARHEARGLPRSRFVEAYTRFAKSLIALGDGAGADAPTGMETEIVALANPYTETPDRLPVQVLYRGEPRADAQVELFEKATDGTVDVTLHRTDADGIAAFPVKPGHRYLVDAVLLRDPEGEVHEEAVWETLWASLTFCVPQ